MLLGNGSDARPRRGGGRGVALDAGAEAGRDGVPGPREPGRIGFAALRGGSVAASIR